MPPRGPQPLAQVRRFAERERLFRRVEKVVVGVSGGPDSVATLLLLRELGSALGFEVAAAHFDHQLRDGSADDRTFVSEICAGLGVACVTGEGDVRLAMHESGRGVEETARLLRYQFLAFAAERQQAAAVVTGHTADDQVETVLHHLVRGSGVRGARGMLPSGPLLGSPSLRLLRPLLPLTRADTLAVCEAAGIEPRHDETNAAPEATRNRLRHTLLPHLREENPSVDTALLGLAESARELFRAVEESADLAQPRDRVPGAVVFPLDTIRGLGSEARLLVIEREAAFLKTEIEANRTRLRNLGDVLGRGSGRVRFGGLEVQVSSGLVRLRAAAPGEPPPVVEENVLNLPGVTVAGEQRVQAATEPFASEDAAPPSAAVATDRIEGALRVRALRSGDRMHYHGLLRKVTGVLQAARIPAWERGDVVVIADRERVVALLGPTLALADEGEGDCLYFRLAPPAPPALIRVDDR